MRDNLHAADLAEMFWHYLQAPRPGEVYNAGGGRANSCSVREAIRLCESLTGRTMQITYDGRHRLGDHRWYITDDRKFRSHYPNWSPSYDLAGIGKELVEHTSQHS